MSTRCSGRNCRPAVPSSAGSGNWAGADHAALAGRAVRGRGSARRGFAAPRAGCWGRRVGRSVLLRPGGRDGALHLGGRGLASARERSVEIPADELGLERGRQQGEKHRKDKGADETHETPSRPVEYMQGEDRFYPRLPRYRGESRGPCFVISPRHARACPGHPIGRLSSGRESPMDRRAFARRSNGWRVRLDGFGPRRRDDPGDDEETVMLSREG
jgi:hypothetical protein